MKYNITFSNDMGHLTSKPGISELPMHIYNFAFEKVQNKFIYATDTLGLGCRFYVLKRGLANKWTYTIGPDTIMLDYSKLDKYDPSDMKIL